jgi:putative salt-induced outer membrane protein YdiY
MKLSNFVRLLLFACLFTSPASAQLDYEIAEGEIQKEVKENPWKGSAAAGLNGKTGNSQNLDINASINLARETDLTKTTVLATYFYAANDTSTVTDRVFAQARQERKLKNPKYSLFFQFGYEWDRFKNFDYRVALHSGLAYQVYKEDDGSLNLRFGAGASKEVGTPADDWLPELQFGGDWDRQVTDTLRLYANIYYFPNIEDFTDFRLNTNTGLEFVVDETRNINFRIFALNRYDSTPPAGNQQNDIDYGMAIVVGL